MKRIAKTNKLKKQKLFKLCVAALGGAKYGASRGLSILISVVLVALVVLFSIGVTTMVTESTRQSANIKQGTTAYYAAEAGIEEALWVNQKLASSGASIGANEASISQTIGSAITSTKYKIQGNTTSLVEQTVNGKYIIPFPWTGNVPWHGEGSVAGAGGCNPEKPPVRTDGYFEYPIIAAAGENKPPISAQEIDHPCNWGRLKVGEKAVIPLFSVNGDQSTNFNSFILKLRAPCMNDKEFCEPGERMELNCFDKGTGEKRCVYVDDISPENQWEKGEVVVSWEIDGDNGNSLLPKQDIGEDTREYFPADSQLNEGKINRARKVQPYLEVLNEFAFGIVGGDTGISKEIFEFLGSEIQKPVLKISIVGSLIGCKDGSKCTFQYDSPDDGGLPPEKNNIYSGPNGIPYLEYQVVLPTATNDNPPANLENVISAEGQSGPFNQTIQVKVPNDNSTLEYVIQQ